MMWLVYLFVILKYVIYGSTVLFVSDLTKSTDVLDLLSLRFLMSSVCLIILKLLGIIKVDFKDKNIKPLFLAALFQPIIYFMFETVGIANTSTIVAGIIMAVAPVIICIVQALVLKEHTNRVQKLFLALGIAGIIYIVIRTGGGGQSTAFGMFCMFMSMVASAFYSVFSRKSSQSFAAIEITFFASMFGAVFFNGINIIRHIAQGTLSSYFVPYMSAGNLVGFVFLAIGATILATLMDNFALSRIQADRVLAFSGITTLVTIIEGVIFKNESLYFFHIIGTVMILVSVIGVNYFAENKK